MPRRKASTAVSRPEETTITNDSTIPESEEASEPRSKRSRKPSRKIQEIEEADDVRSSSKRRKYTPSREKETSADPAPSPSPDATEPEPEVESEAEPDKSPATVTPRRRRAPPSKADATVLETGPETPSKRARGPAKNALTPTQVRDGGITPRRRNAADRSAKKKSMRALIHSIVDDEGGSEDEEQTGLARAIYDSEDEAGAESSGDEENRDPNDAGTPSKKAPARRGRPRKQQKSPTPPRDLPPHEMYFHHSRPGKARTSDNTMSSADFLTHDEYFAFWRTYDDPHAGEMAFLAALHADSFPQWEFELSQDFSVCLYGMGSKKGLLRSFASRIHKGRSPGEDHKIVVVNGYVRTITPRDILAAVSAAIDPKKPLPSAQPALLLESITSSLSPPTTITLLINSIDAPPLRKPATQAILARLASHPRIRLLCSADTPDFPLLWDISLRCTFNFLFHDATTLAPLSSELSAVDDVHELLGRAARRAGGLDAVFVVLRSLTGNARRLYGLLLAEVLTALGEGEGAGDGDGENPGIEFRMLFSKAVEAFVCPSSEMAFRQLLREFLDHQMITNKKDALGTELISVPFRQEEMEAILEDIES